MDWLFGISAALLLLSLIIIVHYHGWQMGYKYGFKNGRTKINKFILKSNEALGEKIQELMDERK